MKFLDLLQEVRTNGMTVTMGSNYSKKDKLVIIAVILHLLSKESLFVEESMEKVVIAADKSILESYKCNGSETKGYENKDKSIEELFTTMKFSDDYIEYKNKWAMPETRGNRSDIENGKRAKEFLNSIKLVVNEEGHLLLAEDSEYNTVWAYVLRHKNSGSISYGVYKRDFNGRPSKTEWIAPSVVSEMGTKVSNLIKNYEGTFNSKDGVDATMKLWCWNLVKTYEPQNEIDDYDQLDIFESLKEWIIENVGKEFLKNKDNGQPISKPFVYFNELKDRVDVGIWSDDLESVFNELEIEEKPKAWLREAVKERWIVPQLNGKGSFVRIATNTSASQREAFNRKNKNERFYKFSFNDEEIKIIVERYHTRMKELYKNKENYIECDLSKEVQ